MTALIEAKVEGREIVAPPPQKEIEVINLMDALRKSVARAKEHSGKVAAKPSKKMAASRRGRSATLKKKSS